jgi:general secretion pathway protein A
MFAGFYDLTGRPFQLNPDHRFFFGSRSHQKAMSYLNYGLHQGEGFIVITGEIGAGKTTLVAYLLSQLDTSRFVVGKVVTTQTDAEDTLRMVASAFGIPHEGVDKATLLRRFENFLTDHQRYGKRVLLLIDEVQNLPPRAVEELRMLSNFQVNNQAPLQIYLIGQPQFRQTLAHPSLEQLRQRVIATYHLMAMEPEETRAYIEHRLSLVNWSGDPKFSDDAFVKIHAACGGVPRKINTLCTRLLLLGELEETHVIDGDLVDEVVKEIQQEGAAPTSAYAGDGLPSANLPASSGGAFSAPPGYAQQQQPQSSGVPAADFLALVARVAAVEKSAATHDRAIKRMVDLLAASMETAENTQELEPVGSD